ncbi:hypothetical protein DPMN_084380 [Dreissena polymorpha]|uniref:Uncharacterized protein n=1 Tax=Dreissena polymorpha TaxID=45954 RepID=A0A9D3YBP0_DREPO|nr:hypothetical protein DPMN_084380 [Dreissena polymorpha]
MVALEVTSRRPEPQNGFPNMFSVMSKVVLTHFYYFLTASSSKFWSPSLHPPRPSSMLPPPLPTALDLFPAM